MSNLVERFLRAKFGNMTCKYHCYTDDDIHQGGELKDILREFQMIIEAGELVEALNPRSKTYTLVDKSKGIVIGSYETSLLKQK